MIDIIKMAQECPNVTISVTVDDLVKANQRIIAQVKQELEQTIVNSQVESYLTREMVMSKFNVVPSTLWRWQRKGYLVPITVGGQMRYKSSDINSILEGKR